MIFTLFFQTKFSKVLQPYPRQDVVLCEQWYFVRQQQWVAMASRSRVHDDCSVWCGRSGPTFDAAKWIRLWCQHGYYQPWSIANSFGWWHPMSFISTAFCFGLAEVGLATVHVNLTTCNCRRQFVVDGGLAGMLVVFSIYALFRCHQFLAACIEY